LYFQNNKIILSFFVILDRIEMLESIRRFFKFIHWLYLQYLLNTALYMLEPWERALFSTLLFAIISTAIYSALVFLPHHVRSLIQFYSWSRTNMYRKHFIFFYFKIYIKCILKYSFVRLSVALYLNRMEINTKQKKRNFFLFFFLNRNIKSKDVV
jgi:hypothetical protein